MGTMVGKIFVYRGERWMVAAVHPDDFCTLVADDPIRAATFDDEVQSARVPLAALRRRQTLSGTH